MSETPHGAVPSGTKPADSTPSAAPSSETGHNVSLPPKAPVAKTTSRGGKFPRRLIVFGVVVIVVAAALYLGWPTIWRMFNTISTDDAYVNGHVTFVALRVSGQVVNVLVDNNNRVRKGDILVQLDKEPFQIQVDLQQAIVDTAKVEVLVSEDEARAEVAQARAGRFKLEHTIEDVNNQIAVLKANVAALHTAEARLARADADYKRALDVQRTPGAISQQDVDLRKEAYRVTEAQVQQALQQVYQVRVSLGLPAEPEAGQDLTDVPKDLDQNFSTVREALGQLLFTAAPLGITPPSYNATPNEVIEAFYKRDPSGNLDKIYAKVIEDAPQIKLAKAKLEQAQAQLDQAKLNLSYCDVVSDIDGVVTRRNVNPGNNLQAGQEVMAVRSITEIWIDANFKETQLGDLRIGQRAELEVDMYGRHHLFEGRISGFTMGTGSSLELLPPENATGNFVKIVQRLPVRIELTDYDPDKFPLFIGLSVEPYVDYNEPATGPHAGAFLQLPMELPTGPPNPVPGVTPGALPGTPPEKPAEK